MFFSPFFPSTGFKHFQIIVLYLNCMTPSRVAYTFKIALSFLSIQFLCMPSSGAYSLIFSQYSLESRRHCRFHSHIIMSVVLSMCIVPHHKPAGLTSVMIWNKSAKDHVWKCRPIAKLANYLDEGPGGGCFSHNTLLSVSIYLWRPPQNSVLISYRRRRGLTTVSSKRLWDLFFRCLFASSQRLPNWLNLKSLW